MVSLVEMYERFLQPFSVLVTMMQDGKVTGLPHKDSLAELKAFKCTIQINRRFVFSLEIRETHFGTCIGEVEFVEAPPVYCSRAYTLPDLAQKLLEFVDDWGDCPVERLNEKRSVIARLRTALHGLL